MPVVRIGKGMRSRPRAGGAPPPPPPPPPTGTGTFTGAAYVFTAAGWAMFAHVFDEGQVLSYERVVLGGFSTQNNILRTYPDGSIRHMLITVNVPVTGTHTLQRGTAATGTFAPAAPGLTVDVTPEGGTLRTATFTDTFYANAVSSGPLMKVTKQTVGFTSSTGALAQCAVCFYLYSFNDGTHRVAMAIENCKNHADAGAIAATVAMKVNGSAVYTRALSVTTGPGTVSIVGGGTTMSFSVAHGLSVHDHIRPTSGTNTGLYAKVWRVDGLTAGTSGFYFYAEAGANTWQEVSNVISWGIRAVRRFNIGGHTQAQWAPDLETFYTADALFRPHTALSNRPYSQTITVSYPNQGPTQQRTYASADWELFNPGIWYPYFSHGGARPEWGFTPEWNLQWEKYKTPALYTWMLSQADQGGSVSKFLHKSDNTLQTLADDTTFDYNQDGVSLLDGPRQNRFYCPTVAQDSGSGGAHYPDFCYVPYLVTGDLYYLDQLKQDAVTVLLNTASAAQYRNGGAGLLFHNNNGMRGPAWTVRNIVQVVAFAPDGDALRSPFQTIIANNQTQQALNIANEPDPRGGLYYSTEELPSEPSYSRFHQMLFQVYFLEAADYARRNGITFMDAYADRIINYYLAVLNGRTTAGEPEYIYNGNSSIYYVYNDTTNAFFTTFAAMWTYNKASGQWGSTLPKAYGNDGYAPFFRLLLGIARERNFATASAWFDWLEAKADDGLTYKTYDWANSNSFSYGGSTTALQLGAASASATTYYVATTGSDARTAQQAQDPATPFLTIEKAISVMTAGTRVQIMAGSYARPTSNPPAGTSFTDATVVQRYGSDVVTVRGWPAMNTASQHHIIFDGLIFDGTALGFNETVYIDNAAHHIRFTNCQITGGIGTAGLALYGTGGFHELLNCRIHHNGDSTQFDHGVYIKCPGNLIEGCEIDNNGAAGLHFYNGGVDMGGGNVVRANYLHHNTTGVISWDTAGIAFSNNVFYSHPGQGISMNRCSNATIYNNTIVSTTENGVDLSNSTAVEFKNNIFYGNVVNINNLGTSTVFTTNLCDDAGTGCSIVGDPLFVNAASDWHLQSGSPAKNAGTTLAAVPTDKDGVARPQGASYDIGAYEFVGG